MKKSDVKNKKRKRLFSKTSSLRSYIWISFIVFTFAILGLLWFFQYLLLESYYSTMKTDQLVKVAENISANPETPMRESFQDRINIEAFKNSVCIAVTDTRGNPKFFCNMLGGSSMLERDILTNFCTMIYGIKSDYEYQKEEIMTQVFENADYESKAVVVTTQCELKGETVYVYIESSLEMPDSTFDIIKTQLFYITIILFELAFIITLFISSRLSKPITKITDTAKRFAEGDYTAKFEDSSYVETKELAKVLDKARKEVSKVSDLRRDLIANVSHDLRTPLTIIKSYAEMIRDISGNRPEKREEHLQVIIDESDRLSALVSSLLELSKLETGNMEMDISEFSINQKLDEIMQRYALLCENDGYNITLQKDQDRICRADVAKIEQVFYNLINNAVNYCGEGKKISVIQINKKDAVRIEVHDDGEGIPKDQLPVIFDRYYRNERHKRDKMGTGLGLSIVKEILKQHEFPYGVSSEVGKGSVFWFEIVLSDEK